ncbi:MAG: RcpC/CpaB family pilus assembly protein [Clostridia bacterium]
MKFIRNKFVIGLLCIAIGITAGFILLPKSQKAEIDMTRVVRLRQNVKAGTRLEREMLETITIPAASVPDGASSSPESFLSRYSSSQLYAGDTLTAAKVRDTLADPVAAGAAKGKQLVSVTIPSLSAGVSGTLKPGDVVSVMVTSKVTQFNQQLGLLAATEQTATPSQDGAPEADEPSGEASNVSQTLLSSVRKESQTLIPEQLRYLEVCKITASDGTDALVNAVKDPEQGNRLPATVTFYATEEQALKLAEIEQNGEVHIAFLARGNAADVFIPRAERVLAEEEIPGSTVQPEPVSTGTAEPIAQATQNPDFIGPTEQPSDLPAATEAPTIQPEPTPIDRNRPEVGE